MKVGLISDIHSNLPALEAVLDDMPSVDALVCVGDIVGYSAWPAECVECIREKCDVVVQGNHDRDVQTPDSYAQNKMAHAGLEHALSQLSTEQIAWLSQLPASTLAFDDQLFVVHSHPENVDRYVTKAMFPSVSTYMYDKTKILTLGHTHKQAAVNMSQFDRHGWVVNPGSVGQPRDGNPKAAYALVDLDQPLIELHRVGYPIKKVRLAHEELDLPSGSANRLIKGK